MTTENKYFREFTLNLRRAGFTVGPEADNLLPVELDGELLCVATEGGSMRIFPSPLTRFFGIAGHLLFSDTPYHTLLGIATGLGENHDHRFKRWYKIGPKRADYWPA